MERKKLKPLTSTQLKFTCLGHTITSSKHMNKERHFTQHRGTSVYEHSIGVAYTSYFIARHMFPLTPIPPKHREGILVSIMDKVCAICEMMNIRYLSKAMRLQYHLD